MSARAYTEEEARDAFLEHVATLIDYWAGGEGSNVPQQSPRARLEGLAFSMLVLLDGGTHLPAWVVTPNPHPDDQAFLQARGENWWPQTGDIAGALHELIGPTSDRLGFPRGL